MLHTITRQRELILHTCVSVYIAHIHIIVSAHLAHIYTTLSAYMAHIYTTLSAYIAQISIALNTTHDLILCYERNAIIEEFFRFGMSASEYISQTNLNFMFKLYEFNIETFEALQSSTNFSLKIKCINFPSSNKAALWV